MICLVEERACPVLLCSRLLTVLDSLVDTQNCFRYWGKVTLPIKCTFRPILSPRFAWLTPKVNLKPLCWTLKGHLAYEMYFRPVLSPSLSSRHPKLFSNHLYHVRVGFWLSALASCHGDTLSARWRHLAGCVNRTQCTHTDPCVRGRCVCTFSSKGLVNLCNIVRWMVDWVHAWATHHECTGMHPGQPHYH